VSAPDAGGAGLTQLAACRVDVLQLGVRRGAHVALAGRLQPQGLVLPEPRALSRAPGGLVLALRPQRWLLLLPPAPPGASCAHWAGLCADLGFVVDLSAGLRAQLLTGTGSAALLAHGCRLDLAAGSFPVGRIAATSIAQTPVVLAAVPRGLLLLTPATLAQHFTEWLHLRAGPAGLAAGPDATVAFLSDEAVL
jgi:heterotetrameric sarcosine oxidase gamma subunit